ncbi:TPA: GGDEF domain-containing protein [Aeromonas salmonicida]|jgi:diguanylate cyclase|uniref:GGDEF domain-containing protein n=1 Tax=Aeromonas salmonicida TaxID=645 RepID=UPI000452DFD2|nr:GGDEF domain-containing protein [Aeromonas salmonicida]ELI6405451.1 GGDEF domain-containing protein [Aeromonas salmonicida subsp. salmonicida]ASI23878.1 GGDEF domain-containing protein [Aeromonas salmonicida]ASI28198.1 GGDEF domain-containing protein [Aeromonas salmonicida]ASI32330.1 GGDEF domain-containing protein [Aeromonas salmonicida]ATD38552.1 diguanylate cyclase [Aeromonas salmonicida subsp. masoucida]
MDTILQALSVQVTEARDLESLTRPLLEMLETVTGLESTYLTQIDLEQSAQHILYARNSAALQIPEGGSVDWSDTLCRRALDEGRLYAADVADRWGDSAAARAMGIRTYMSSPVRTSSGSLYGTLCGASAEHKPLVTGSEHLIAFFARLIAEHVEREQLLQQLQQANNELSRQALSDPLTGLPNRRALMLELHRLFSLLKRTGHPLLISFIDLDGFKAINDTHGHDAGDLLLQTMAQQLAGALRSGDLLARVGGDEFVAVGMGPLSGEETVEAAVHCFQRRLFEQSQVQLPLASQVLNYPGASVGVVAVDPASISIDDALRQADACMYAVKRQRRAQS